MAASTIEVLLKFTGDPRNAKDAIAQVRADLAKSAQQQVTSARNVNKQVATEAKNQTKTLEKEERDRNRAAESLQRQRSAALIAAWKAEAREKLRIQKETDKANEKAGQLFNLDSLLGNIPALRGVTSQFSALSTEAAGATTALAGAAGAIGIVAAGAAVGIGVLVKLGAEIFDLTKKTAAFQGKFFDLSQQVGVSVETLSTLDVIASTTGGNIDTVTGSLALFQRNLEDAHDPTSKEAKLLGELGVTSLDTEVALRQTIKGLFALGEGSKQTDATLQLFGRSGRFVNAILKESKGDLDAAAKAFGGLQISREAAAAADAFNDSLEILNRTLARVGANIVSSSIPIFTTFFQDLNKGLTGNAEDWSFWASVIQAEVAGVLGTLQGFVLFVKSGFNIDLGLAIDSSIQSLLDRSEKLRNKTRFESDVDKIQRITQGILAGRPGDTPDAGKGNSEAQARAAKSIALQQRALEESTRFNREQLERERDKDLANIDEWVNQSIIAANEHLAEQRKIYDQESANVLRFITNRADALLAETEIQQKQLKAARDNATQIQKIHDEAQKRRDQAELTLNQQLVKIRDAQRDQELQQIKSDLDLGVIAESGAILRRMALLEQEFEDRKILRDLERAQQSTSAERKQQLDQDEIESEIRKTTEFKRLTGERIAAMVKEGAAATPRPGQRVPTSERQDAATAGAAADRAAGAPPLPGLDAAVRLATEAGGVFAGLGTILSDTFELGAGGAVAFADTLSSAFGQVASAVGDAVHAFVLFGTVEGGFKKFAAQVIASLAAQATVQALFQFAQGLAWLALNFFFPNPQYALAATTAFAAAAAFGLIAGVTVPLGRSLAGNSFSQAGGGGGGGSTTSSSNVATTSQPKPVEFDRNVRNEQAVTVLVNVTRDPGSIVEAVVLDGRAGGPIRQLIQSEMAS